MSTDRLRSEEEAFASLTELLASARRTKMLFENAGMALPEPLKRVLGMNGLGRAETTRPHMPPIQRASVPDEAQDDWISVRAQESTPTSVVLAVLRGAKGPMRAKDVVSTVTKILPNVPRGSINNIGSRLRQKIRRTKEGWMLVNPESSPLLDNEYLWGPQAVFEKTEVAAHRRESILHLLSGHQSGLQIVQIVEQLRQCPWVHAPINKDLVKADMGELKDDGKVRRVGNSKKWELLQTDSRSNH